MHPNQSDEQPSRAHDGGDFDRELPPELTSAPPASWEPVVDDGGPDDHMIEVAHLAMRIDELTVELGESRADLAHFRTNNVLLRRRITDLETRNAGLEQLLRILPITNPDQT